MGKLLPLEPSMMTLGKRLAVIYRFSRSGSSDAASATWMPCPRAAKKEPEDEATCRETDAHKSHFFRAPRDCMSDDKLSKLDRMIALGIPRCTPSFVLDKKCDGKLHDPCTWERMDALHYKPSRSLHRKFEKYWVECVPQKLPKRRCVKKPVVICRRTGRKRRCGGGGGCNVSKCKVLLGMSCNKLTDVTSSECMKFPLCECPKAARNTKCRLIMRPSKCKNRRLTRYPSFSECLYDKLPKKKITECQCWHGTSLCEVWKAFSNYRKPC